MVAQYNIKKFLKCVINYFQVHEVRSAILHSENKTLIEKKYLFLYLTIHIPVDNCAVLLSSAE